MEAHSPTSLRETILDRVGTKPNVVWTPGHFSDLGGRASVDKALQRLANEGTLRRIDRGLYDKPSLNPLTNAPRPPDYRAVTEAVLGRGRARYLVDGMTAANDLGLTTAVPARIEVWTDARLQPVKLGNQEIAFKTAAPRKLFWTGRPAMRIVQALSWLDDVLDQADEKRKVRDTLELILRKSRDAETLRKDLRDGFAALPIWMQDYLRPIVFEEEARK